MDAAREKGATGGTIVTARGTAAKELEKSFGFTVTQEKELILILTTKEKKNDIMTAICKSAGLNTQGKGITFSLPVDDVLGVSLGINAPKEEPAPVQEEAPKAPEITEKPEDPTKPKPEEK